MITYAQYQAAKGQLSEDDFDIYEPRAASYVTALTFGEDLTVTSQVTSCLVELIDSVIYPTSRVPVGATSYSNDGVSVSYGSSSESGAESAIDASAVSVVTRWLAPTGVLFRGVRRRR